MKQAMLPILSVLLLAACGDITPGEAKEGYDAAYAALQSAEAASHAGALTAAQVDGSLSYAYPCTGGGTVALSGTYAGPAVGQEPTFDLTGVFTDCVEQGVKMNGSLLWSTEVANASFASDLTGTITFEEKITFPCDFDVHATGDRSGWSVTGSVCGQPVEKAGVTYRGTR
jgi:hypothetical protein